MSQSKPSLPFPLSLKSLKSSFVCIYPLQMGIIDHREVVGLKSHNGLCWNITLITFIQGPIQDLCVAQEDASKVIEKVEPGSLCLRRTQMVEWNWTLHAFKGSWSAFTKIKKKGIQQRLSKVQSFCCYHVVSFHISLLCNKVCSLEPQFGPVTKQKIFSLPHSSEILSSEQLWVPFFYLLSSFLSNMQGHSREAVSGNTFSLGFHEAF